MSPSFKNLFLIGYRGTGKSTVVAILGSKLGWRVIDADVYLEDKAGRTIRDIFAEEGEAGFRDKESAVLEEICQASQQVVATGGGVILRPENRLLLKQNGFVVWLAASEETIWRRLQEDSTTHERRPNLTVGGLQEIRELLALRGPLYEECADMVVSTDERSPQQVAEAIYAEASK